ncbi:MAG: FGGY family carbohydrate kinase, partial [Halopseudomonas sp.]
MQQPSHSRSQPVIGAGSGPLFLVLDQGGSQSRALVYNQQGDPIAQAQRPVDTQYPAPRHVEHHPEQLVASLQQCAAEAVEQLKPMQQQQLKYWGLACQRSSFIAWDNNTGQPLTPVISWQDTRASDESHWSEKQIELLTERTGLHPSHHLSGGKMRWCLAHHQPVIDAAKQGRLQMAPLASYLAMALTGAPAKVDASTAQRTLLWAYQSLDWQPALLNLFGINRNWLPPTCPCVSDWGALQIAGITLPGRFVGGDQGCAHYGSGAMFPTTLKVNLGTGSFASLPQPTAAQPPQGLLLSLASDDQDSQSWMIEATINGAGAALNWLQQQHPHIDIKACYRQPLSADPGLFINAVSGLGSPFWRSDLSSEFIDSPTLPQQYSAVIESILFLIQTNLERMQQAGCKIERIELAGGLSQAKQLPQRLADLSRLPLQLQSQAEATARGV